MGMLGWGVVSPPCKSCKLRKPNRVLVPTWFPGGSRNVRPGKGWQGKLSGAASGSLQPVWMVFQGREGVACGCAHVCLLQQLLQTAVEKLSVVFVLPNSGKAGADPRQRPRKCRKGDLGRRSPEAEAGGRRMPPSDFCGML